MSKIKSFVDRTMDLALFLFRDIPCWRSRVVPEKDNLQCHTATAITVHSETRGLVLLKVFAPMTETLRKNVRRTGRQRLSARSHFPIHGSTVLSCKYMMCVFSVLWCSAVANGELACEDHEDPVNLLQHGGVHDKVNLTTMFDAQVVEDRKTSTWNQ